MRKESKNYSLWQRLSALFLAAVMVLGMVPANGITASAAESSGVQKLSDPETLTRPLEIYGDNTLNAGKVTVDKSVSKDAVTVDGQSIGLTGENNFLVTISQFAQVMGLSSETSVPVDVVFVVDTSGSMDDNNRAESLVTAANSAIATLMATNEQNRVAVVAFSSEGNYGGGTSGGAAANVLSSLAHYSGDAATAHLQWVTSEGSATGNDRVYIAGRDQTTITTTEWQQVNGRWQEVQVQKTINAYRHGKYGGTNIQAGIVAGAKILTAVQDTTWTNPDTNEVVNRIPFLIVISDGQPTFSYDDQTWYDPTITGNNAADEQGPGSGAYEGNGFIAALTAAYYKGKITEHYYGDKANADNRCFVYTMGVEIEALDDYENNRGQMVSAVGDNQSLAQITLDPATYAVDGQQYYTYGNSWNDNSKQTTNGWKTYWNNYVAGNAFNVRVNNNVSYTFTANSIAASKQYVNGIGYTGGLAYNDDYFAADDVEDMEAIFEALIAEISKKSISVPTKVTTGDHDFDGYVTFTDPLGEYMEVKDMKGVIADGYFYQGASAAQYMASGTNAEFNALLEKVLTTRMSMTASSISGEELLNVAKASPYQAYYNSPTDYDNSIVWWGSEYHTGEEDVQVQVVGAAENDTIKYIEEQKAAGTIPADADYVCRSYFFYGTAGGTVTDANHEYLYFVVRVQRSIHAPYQQTVVISAPASLLAVEKVMVNESFDDNGDPVYTVSVEEAQPARVVYEVGLWDSITAESVSAIVSDDYATEAVNGQGHRNMTVNGDGQEVYHFFTNDWDRTENQDEHHRAQAKATFDAAADNSYYTYQEDTLLVDANGNPVTSNPAGSTVYYERTYYDWADATENSDGTYTAQKKTELIPVEIPAGAPVLNEDGKWYIPKGTYTASTLIANGEDTEKSSNDTDTAQVVAHPHRTGDATNSHYTVLLGNNGVISLVSDPPEPVKTVENITKQITDADGKAVMVDDVLEYSITAKNYGTETGTIVITDTVPAGTELVSVANDGVHTDGTITWTIENVAPGAEVTVSFRVKVTEAALDNAVVSSTIQNTATAKLDNNPAYESNTTHNPPEGKKVVIQGDPTGTSVQVGDILVYSIEFHNDTGAMAETLTVVDHLPAGTTFVSADHNGVYDADSHTLTWTFTNVAANVGGVVTFTVKVDASAKTPIENGATITIGDHDHDTNVTQIELDKGSLALTKTVVIPEDLNPGTTTFTLTLTDPTGKLNGVYSGVTFTNGVATVEIVDHQTITIEGLPAGVTILVTENVPAGFTASITASGQAVVPVNGTAAVEVTNTYAVTPLDVILQGDKTLNGNSPDDEIFGFTVVPCDETGKTLDDADGITGEVVLTPGTEAITFGKLTFTKSGTYHYLVSEVDGGRTGVTYTTVQYLVTIVVEDNGDGTLSHTTTLQSRADEDDDFAPVNGDKVLFTNRYQPLSTAVTLAGHKTLTGRYLKDGEFSFVVHELDEDGNVMLDDSGNPKVITTGINAADGTISFRPVTYTQAGSHTYVISELNGNLFGVEYSQESYTIIVDVVDQDGQLVATVKDANGDPIDPQNFADTFTFVNVFTPDEVTVTLEAEKDLEGRDLTDGEFSFVVYDEDNNEVASGSNDANGHITFSKIEYFLSDLGDQNEKTFTYTIRELVPDSGVDPNLYYDDLEITVNVTVTYDPATGALTVGNPVYTYSKNDRESFINIQNPDSVSVVPVGTKTTSGMDGIRFSFSVTDLEGNLITSGISDANGPITFAPITYDSDDLGNNSQVIFRYWIAEDNSGMGGITYDTDKYLMVVTLSRSATNALQTSVEYFALKGNGVATNPDDYTKEGTVAFENSYNVVTGTQVPMQVEKDLVNRELDDLKFEFGLYHIVNGEEKLVATATNDVNGLVSFLREYPASVLKDYGNGDTATLRYVIRELNNNIHGVDYTDAQAKPVYVEVIVEDNDQGGMTLVSVKYTYDETFTNFLGENEVPVFTNTYTPDDVIVNLEADKTLIGPDNQEVDLTGGEFNFVVLDNQGNEVAWGTNDADGKIVFTNLVYDFDDVGKIFTYTVKEVKPDAGADPNLYYDPAEFSVSVTITYSEETGELAAQVAYRATASFVNYQNPANIYVTPEGDKTTTGNYPDGTGFSFSVTDLAGNVIASGISDAEGAITFTPIGYDVTDVGTHKYWIVEDRAGQTHAGIHYDDAKYLMVVTVSQDSNNHNALKTTVEYFALKENGDATNPDDYTKAVSVAFENSYNVVNGTRVSLLAMKDLVNRDLGDLKFEFGLYHIVDGQEKLVATTTNDAQGLVSFLREYPANFMAQYDTDHDGEFVIEYVIRELDNNIHGVDYDTALDRPIYVKVTITDNQQGGMDQMIVYSYEPDYDPAIDLNTTVPTFTNTYTPDEVIVNLEADKSLVNEKEESLDLTGGEFNFVVLDEQGTAVAWGTNDENGHIVFTNLVYDFDDAGKTFNYTIVEVIPTDGANPNMLYSNHRIPVTVEVTYDEQAGELETDVKYLAGKVFTNLKNPDTITVVPAGNKTITGDNLPTGLRFSFRVVGMGSDINNLTLGAVEATGVSAGEKNSNDLIHFTGLVFDSDDAGKTFYYLIEEVTADVAVNTVQYDKTQYVMAVTVGRNSKNALTTEVTYYVVADGADATDSANWSYFGDANASVPFTNEYSAYAILNIQGTKEMLDMTLTGGEFDFRLQLLDQDGKPVTSSTVDGVNVNATDIHFGTLIFTDAQMVDAFHKEQIDNGDGTVTDIYEYRVLVSELVPASNAIPGVEYSDELYIAVIHWEVTTNRQTNQQTFDEPYVAQVHRASENEGVYTADPENLLADGTSVKAALTFTNDYNILEGASVTMTVEKVLENLPLQSGMFEFGLYYNGELIATTTNVNGFVSFTREYAATFVQPGQPVTLVYEIRELDNNIHGMDYSEKSVYVKVELSDDDGKIVVTGPAYFADAECKTELTDLTFVNTYTPDPIEENLTADKTLFGPDGQEVSLNGGEFNFVVRDEQGNEVAWGTNDADGNIVFSNLVYDFDDAGKIFTYTVEEVIPDVGADPNMYYDPAVFTVTVAVTYDRQTGLLSAEVTGITKDQTAVQSASFVNYRNPATVTATPEGDKSTSGFVPDGTRFSFSVIDMDGVVVSAGISDPNPENGFTFTPILYDVYDVGRHEYWIVEDNAGMGGITYDADKYLMVVTVYQDAENHNLLKTSVEYFALKENGNADDPKDYDVPVSEAAFQNHYEVVTGTQVPMQVEKDLVNRELGNLKFEFGLYHIVDGQEKLVATATNDVNGLVSFLREYPASVLAQYADQSGKTATLRYVIRELNNNIHGVDYTDAQAKPVYVEVIVEDNDQGGMTLVSVKYTYDERFQNFLPENVKPVFTNTYTPDDVIVNLEADKTLIGPDGLEVTLSGGEFNFVVLDNQGNEVAWGTNDADGKIVFTNLVYDFDDVGNTFTYTVKEVKPDAGADPNMYYDPAVFTVTVAVTYSEETGELTAQVAYSAAASFVNYQNPANIYVTPEGDKTTTGNYPDGTQFSFSVVDMEGNVVSAAISGPNPENGFTFTSIGYDVTDVGTHKYWIVEDRAGQNHAGIHYDTTKYLMVVTVEQDEQNHNALKTTVEYFALEENGDAANPDHYTVPVSEAAFVNEYKVTQPATVTITVDKALEGRDLASGEFRFNLYHIDDSGKTLVATATNGYDLDGDDQITGDEIGLVFFSRTYAASILKEHGDGKTATIFYVIEEQNNNLGGVDYTDALNNPIYVKVVVEDLQNGTMKTTVSYFSDENYTVPVREPGFTNEYTTQDTVFTPAVDKILDGRHMTTGEFSFQVTDLQGNPVTFGLSQAAQSGEPGAVVFGNITYTFADMGGELEKEFIYIISEVPGNLDNVDYSQALANPIYLKVNVTDNIQGVLSAEGAYFADRACTIPVADPTFTNYYTPFGDTAFLKANKVLTGRAPIDGEFSFQVLDEAGNVVATATNGYDLDGDGQITGDEIGQIFFSGIGITADMMGDDLEKDFIFTIRELNTNQGAVNFDSHQFYAKVSVKNNLELGHLEIQSVSYHTHKSCAQGTEINQVEFHNDYNPDPVTISIPVHKDLINRNLNAGDFVFEMKNEAGNVIGSITHDEFGNALFQDVLNYTVHDLEGVTPDANNVRTKTFTYTIQEIVPEGAVLNEDGKYVLNGITYDNTVYTVTVTLTDNGKGRLSASTVITVEGDEKNAVVFTNHYTPDPIEVDLDAAIGATKTIVDDEGNVLERDDVIFTFVVTDLFGNQITEGTAKGANAEDGVMKIDFGTFTFDKEGEYRYLITESTTTLDGYVLDTTVWCTHIQVRYDPATGELSVSDVDVYTHILTPETHAEDGLQALVDEVPAFVNVYDTNDVSLELVLDKHITGDRTTVKEGEFTFQLLNADGSIAGQAKNHQDGTIRFYLDYDFQDLNGQLSRTFTYTAVEIIPEGAVKNADGSYTLNGITYDTARKNITVVLTDNGKGTLTATVAGAQVAGTGTVHTGIAFENEYLAADVTVSLFAVKQMEGMPLEDNMYTFKLLDSEGILVTEGHNLANGTIVFDKELTFTEPGTYTYTMVEFKGSRPGVTFDETSFTVTVEVTDNGKGNLEAKVTYATSEGVYDHPVFINIYTPTGIRVQLQAHKDLTGRDLKDREFTFQLKDSEGNVVSEAKNNADGTVSFETQTYETVGEYVYTIVEVIPEEAVQNEDGTYTLNGVTYDQTVYTVVVEITDPGFDGQLDKKVTYYLGTDAIKEDKVVFTNTYATADSNPVVIEGEKVLENWDLQKETFEFQLKDSEGNVLQTVTHDADGNFRFEELKYSFADMDGKTEQVFAYTVSEVQGTLGGVTYDKTVYTVTVTVTDDGLGNLTAVAVITGGKNNGEIRFTNVYEADAVQIDVTAKKELSGKELKDGEFQFVLVNQANKDEQYTATNKADGTITFEDLSFSVAGTYVYNLYEVKGADTTHYTYDDKVFVVTITVVDNGDGTMTATASSTETLVFRNVYHPDPIVVVLEGTKDLTGRDQVAGEFDFEVRDEEGNLVTTGTNKADGTIVFENIVIDNAVELILKVTEVKGTDKYMEYDDYVYRVKLTVTNENGVLKADVQYLDGEIVFYNEYELPETPPTGDDTPVHLYMSLMAISAAALMAMLVLGRKKRERKFF